MHAQCGSDSLAHVLGTAVCALPFPCGVDRKQRTDSNVSSHPSAEAGRLHWVSGLCCHGVILLTPCWGRCLLSQSWPALSPVQHFSLSMSSGSRTVKHSFPTPRWHTLLAFTVEFSLGFPAGHPQDVPYLIPSWTLCFRHKKSAPLHSMLWTLKQGSPPPGHTPLVVRGLLGTRLHSRR